jgi:hypothetical protein
VARHGWIAAARVADLGPQALAQARRRLGRLGPQALRAFSLRQAPARVPRRRYVLQRLGKGLPFDSAAGGGYRMRGRFGASLSHARGWVRASSSAQDGRASTSSP